MKTPQLYERNRQLRLELQMLYKQADTIISHAQGMVLSLSLLILKWLYGMSVHSVFCCAANTHTSRECDSAQKDRASTGLDKQLPG